MNEIKTSDFTLEEEMTESDMTEDLSFLVTQFLDASDLIQMENVNVKLLLMTLFEEIEFCSVLGHNEDVGKLIKVILENESREQVELDYMFVESYVSFLEEFKFYGILLDEYFDPTISYSTAHFYQIALDAWKYGMEHWMDRMPMGSIYRILKDTTRIHPDWKAFGPQDPQKIIDAARSVIVRAYGV